MNTKYLLTTNPTNQHEDELLARCYQNVLSLAEKHQLKTIAFPAISTGAYGFPLERAARIALREISYALSLVTFIQKVYCVTFSNTDLQIYK